jgi:hypothetical protein
LDINKQIFIMGIMIGMAVTVGIPALEMQYAYANVNNIDDCGNGPSWHGGAGVAETGY